MVETVEELEEILSEPSGEVDDVIRNLKGDIVILGVAGKMGPTIARMLANSCRKTGVKKRITGVSRFSDKKVKEEIERCGIVALSTGNVYPFSKVTGKGCRETDPAGPVGEYAQSCLGRERIFRYFSEKNSTPVTIVRLNYAAELRYGVLVDIAEKVRAPVRPLT